ncbi:MAG TPA: serine/threonine-protein kinase [bacterium]|nr:serine/threonine-protein kinase [bacterium]
MTLPLDNNTPFDPEKTIVSKAAVASQTDLTGASLGEYEIVREIGRGGMGVVYEAFQKSLNRRVAVKVLPKTFSLRPDFVERFRKEAKVIASLSHPNIIAIYFFGIEEGTYYFAMELVEGTPLSSVLEKHLQLQRLPTIDEALRIVKEVAGGLHYAHQRGIIHLDVKPGNILIDADGWPRITDFGLVRLVNLADTNRSEIAGTPNYMSPEQAMGKPLDRRSDIYSLGCVLYELLTGRTPFNEGSFAALIDKITTAAPAVPSQITHETPYILDTIVMKMLEKDPAKRYQTLDEFLNVLDRFQKGLLRVSIHDEKYQRLKVKTYRMVAKAVLYLAIALAVAFLAAIPGWNLVNEDWARTQMRVGDMYVANRAYPHARQAYREIIRKIPLSKHAVQAKTRLDEIRSR